MFSNTLTSIIKTFNPEMWIEAEISDYAVIILNRNIQYPKTFFLPFWNNAKIRLTVDAGTNKLYRYMKDKRSDHLASHIDIVCGDFDSITDDCMEKAKERGARIINTHDQDETDFTKAVRVLSEHCTTNNIELKYIFVICQTCGRMDHIMANVDTLFRCSTYNITSPNTTIVLFSLDSLSWIIQAGKNKIFIADPLKDTKKAWCGLIPIGEKCNKVTTTGLKWNFNANEISMGTLISTSNTYDGSDFITIENSNPLLWTMGILPMFDRFYDMLDQEILF